MKPLCSQLFSLANCIVRAQGWIVGTLEKLFFKYGRSVSGHPFLYILFCLVSICNWITDILFYFLEPSKESCIMRLFYVTWLVMSRHFRSDGPVFQKL